MTEKQNAKKGWHNPSTTQKENLHRGVIKKYR